MSPVSIKGVGSALRLDRRIESFGGEGLHARRESVYGGVVRWEDEVQLLS